MRPFSRAQQSSNKLAIGSLVEYQQHGKYCLGIVIAEKRSKFSIRNAQNASLELSAERLRIVEQTTPIDSSDTGQCSRYLQDTEARVTKELETISLAEAWELLLEEGGTHSVEKITDILFQDPGALEQAIARRALTNEQPYFKRQKKGELFEARTPELVEELLHQQKVEQEKQAQRERWITQALARMADHSAPLPEPLELIEQLAAQGKSAPQAKEAQVLIDEVFERAKITSSKATNQRAFDLLVAIGHFSPHELLTPYRLQRPLRFSAQEINAAEMIATEPQAIHTDKSQLCCITIDGAETKDFDDALSFERIDEQHVRVGVHISDLASIIQEDSLLEQIALRRSTSVYCPDRYYPMLPRVLSEERMSLQEGTMRPVLSCYFLANAEFEILDTSFALDSILITKRATYEEVDRLLCDGQGELSEYEELLRYLWDFSSTAEMRRIEQGAAQFMRRELTPKIDQHYHVTLEVSDEDTPARKLVSELMVLHNCAAADFAAQNEIPLLFRAQAAPEVDYTEQGLDIPEGPARSFFQRSFFKRSTMQVDPAPHFGLGVERYTQTTSPLRRVVDLINQQQIRSFLTSGAPRYSKQVMKEKLEEVQKGIDEAFQIQRESNRYWILQYFVQEKIKEISATVLKVDGPRPLAELDTVFAIFPFQMKKGQKAQRGERVLLEVVTIDPRRDSFILRLAQRGG